MAGGGHATRPLRFELFKYFGEVFDEKNKGPTDHPDEKKTGKKRPTDQLDKQKRKKKDRPTDGTKQKTKKTKDRPTDRTNEKKRKKQSVSQTIDQVMTIKTHTESSKSELSSRGKRPFKVFRFSLKKHVFVTWGAAAAESKLGRF